MADTKSQNSDVEPEDLDKVAGGHHEINEGGYGSLTEGGHGMTEGGHSPRPEGGSNWGG
jgi:hypothetical protein